MNVDLRPEASADLVSSPRHFNDTSTGWGDYFLDSLRDDLFALRNEAGIDAKLNGLPCKFCKAFPFAIYYKIENDTAVVYAILSYRMDPGSHETILLSRQ